LDVEKIIATMKKLIFWPTLYIFDLSFTALQCITLHYEFSVHLQNIIEQQRLQHLTMLAGKHVLFSNFLCSPYVCPFLHFISLK